MNITKEVTLGMFIGRQRFCSNRACVQLLIL